MGLGLLMSRIPLWNFPAASRQVIGILRQESVSESAEENSRYRHVYIMYFMEDGTLGINEPKVENSGLPQGNFLKRQKVEKEDGTYIGPDDFQIGSEVTICGHTFHICGCDRFTRWFFEENGVAIEEAHLRSCFGYHQDTFDSF